MIGSINISLSKALFRSILTILMGTIFLVEAGISVSGEDLSPLMEFFDSIEGEEESRETEENLESEFSELTLQSDGSVFFAGIQYNRALQGLLDSSWKSPLISVFSPPPKMV